MLTAMTSANSFQFLRPTHGAKLQATCLHTDQLPFAWEVKVNSLAGT
jgi:hypothetical protein